MTSNTQMMHLLNKNTISVINYSPSSHSNPVELSFIFGSQMKIFFDEIRELSDPSIDSNATTTSKVQKASEEIHH